MTKNGKPLFPRESEGGSEAQSDLLKDVKEKLDAAESKSEFVSNERFMSPRDVDAPRPPAPAYGPPPLPRPPAPMYGPPPLPPPPAPAYGPPPLPIVHKPIFLFLLVGLLLLLFAIYMVITFLK